MVVVVVVVVEVVVVEDVVVEEVVLDDVLDVDEVAVESVVGLVVAAADSAPPSPDATNPMTATTTNTAPPAINPGPSQPLTAPCSP